VYEPNGVQIQLLSGVDCPAWLNIVRNNADVIWGQMVQAMEAARRQGVYPGVTRDIRRQFKMEGPDW
jgi:hypothetical protein